MLQELRELLDNTPHETARRKANGHPITMMWFVDDAVDEIEDSLVNRLKHVEIVGLVKADPADPIEAPPKK